MRGRGRTPPFIVLRRSRGYSMSSLYMETLSTGRRLLRGYSTPRYTWKLLLEVGDTQVDIFCVFFPVFTYVFFILHLWVPAYHNSPELMELISYKPYN